jgi:hypothetical protein
VCVACGYSLSVWSAYWEKHGCVIKDYTVVYSVILFNYAFTVKDHKPV